MKNKLNTELSGGDRHCGYSMTRVIIGIRPGYGPCSLGVIETSPSIRVLVIDDDAGYLRLISLVLERYGYDVLTADSGEAGAELAGHADVALVDMIMPGMSGLETIPLLRWSNPSLTIFASSGSSQTEFKRELEQLGVDVFLAKPFPAALLVHELQRVAGLVTA